MIYKIIKTESGKPYGVIFYKRRKRLLAMGASSIDPNSDIPFDKNWGIQKAKKRANQALYFYKKGEPFDSKLGTVIDLDKVEFKPRQLKDKSRLIIDEENSYLMV